MSSEILGHRPPFLPDRNLGMELVRAMIADVVPPSFLSKVEIVPADGAKGAGKTHAVTSGVPSVAALKGLPESTTRALEFMGSLAAESMDIRRMLETTAAAMGLR
jgi:hypothetical protein